MSFLPCGSACVCPFWDLLFLHMHLALRWLYQWLGWTGFLSTGCLEVVLIYSTPLRFLFSAKWFACRSWIPCKSQVISNPPWLSIFTLYKVMWTKAPKRNCSTVTLLHGLTDRCIKTVELGWCRFTAWLQLSWAAYLGLLSIIVHLCVLPNTKAIMREISQLSIKRSVRKKIRQEKEVL